VLPPGKELLMKCPKCGRETEWLRSLSRADNKTMICDECGTKEALDAAGLTEGSSIREAIMNDIRHGITPQERTRAKVQATGNRWAIENFNDTHN
jgi:transcription elongation factor Elf1